MGPTRKLTRRGWIRRIVRTAFASCVAAVAYGFGETFWLQVTRPRIRVPGLPPVFDGLTIAFLTDIHHGNYTGIDFVRRVVAATNALKPDLILLGGDYVHGRTGDDYFLPCLAALNELTAPFGVWSVPGNHDYWENIRRYYAAISHTQIHDLCNRGAWLNRGDSRIRLAGVDDHWCGRPDLQAALGDCGPDDVAILLCHNPDYIEERVADPRVRLALCGHLHGGQVLLPFIPPQVPSKYGAKYLKGLVQGPTTPVYVSRGIGTVSLPFRFRSRPEIALITLWAT
ncbi:MAG: metallophosphoesterase [Gemmataceae bacterium]|nr:metallophosphoesterase [Gemmataceae bacterium]